jgi:hypothetical protein
MGRNVLILCNPHNPTGHCWWREDVTKIGEICTQRRVVVPGDEIHCDLCLAALLQIGDILVNRITFKSGTKSFGFVGHEKRDALWQCGLYRPSPDDGRLELAGSTAAVHRRQHVYAESFICANIPDISWVKAQGAVKESDVNQVVDRTGAKDMAAEANKRNASKRPITAEILGEHCSVKNAKVQMIAATHYGLGAPAICG